MRFLVLIVVASAALSGTNAYGESVAETHYLTAVKPVLQRSCFACHSALKQEGNLRLDTADAIIKGGDSGPAITPGDSEDSLLIWRVTDHDELTRMPQEGAPLAEAEIAAIRQWIDEGAKHPKEAIPPDPLEHWSFVRPTRPAVPSPGGTTPLGKSDNPIDRFIAKRHAELGLIPDEQADRYSLLRRVYVDLTGLPPTRDELQAFLDDKSQNAYEKVVDQLLASPRYGERWGRHWMDVWRYSDWDGHGDQVRESQPFMWRWRDWIVESLNADKPYDRMIMEMLAGDEIAPNDRDTLQATGFLARNYHRFNRHTWLGNAVEHTGKAFVGLTLNCAKCHDHKYDPIAQTEYYEWRAAFEPYDVRIDPVPNQPDVAKDGLTRVYDAHLDAKTHIFIRGDEKQPDEESDVKPALPKILGGGPLQYTSVPLPPEAWYPELTEFAQENKIEAGRQKVADAQRALRRANRVLAKMQREAAPDRLPPDPPGYDEANAFIVDYFDKQNESLWLYGKGMWNYRDRSLMQEDGGGRLCMIESRDAIPSNFVAKVAFTVRGGDGYQSVGLSFDFADHDNFNSVYVSAGNPGLEVLHRVRAAEVFPPQSKRPLAIRANKQHELTIAVQGNLLNAWVDGHFALAYELPSRPSRGKMALWTYEAIVEFDSVSLDELGADAHLVAPGEAPESPEALEDPVIKRSKAKREQEAAESAFAVAKAEEAFIHAAVQADRVKYTGDTSQEVNDLVREAVKADRELKVETARYALLLARHATHVAVENSVGGDELARLDAAVSDAKNALEKAESALSDLSGEYSPIGMTYPKASSGRRLALGKAITDRANPLTARVAVNHIWLRHFGAALVPSVFDFGHNGKAPTHPELLDWLAVELMEQGWRMKPLHRLIVTSQAYRLQSTLGEHGDQNMQIDRDNLNYWRMNARRVEAEAVRDAVLLTSGKLDLTMGGPDLSPSSDVDIPRRSIYFRQSKEKRVQFLAVFDQAGVTECYRRSETVVPQQALAMANSELVARSVKPVVEIIAKRLGENYSNELFIDESFLHVVGRPASTEEKKRCLEFLKHEDESPENPVHERFVLVLLNHHDFVTSR